MEEKKHQPSNEPVLFEEEICLIEHLTYLFINYLSDICRVWKLLPMQAIGNNEKIWIARFHHF